LLGHRTPLCGEHSRLNGCPGLVDHYRRSQKPDKNFTLKTSLLIGTLAHRTKRQKSRNLPTTKQQLVLYLSTPAKIFPSGSRQTALPEEKLTKKIYK
ncbi:hypothetical protein KUU23_27540, partial [Pseudomonas aeruginosa]|nr:hypothetical protein [Pseudomonas aeruginosa]